MATYGLYDHPESITVHSIPISYFSKEKKPLNVVIGEGWVPNLTYSNRNICHLFLDRDDVRGKVEYVVVIKS